LTVRDASLISAFMVDIPKLIKRADRFARRDGRTAGGVSKLLFSDVRTLDALRAGARNVQVARLEQAEARMTALEEAEREEAA